MRLVVSDLRCRRGGRLLFAGLSFAVPAGEALLITGPNGSGKSSLLRLLAGLLIPSAGALTLEGGDPELMLGEQAHYLGHQDALKLSLTVGENLRFWTEFLGAGESRIADALSDVGLAELVHLPAAYLSAGQRRRLSIARLIAVKRPVWLLDEPTSALDADAQQMLAELMRAHLAGGGTIVAATHAEIGLSGAKTLLLGGQP